MSDEKMNVLFAYTRKQAIKDGVLVDVSTLAKEAGFKYHVAMTHAAFTRYVEVPEACPWQDLSGRLWDVLWMLQVAIKQTPERNPLHFSLMVQNEPGPAEEVTLKAVCGPDDLAQPCITIMLPNED